MSIPEKPIYQYGNIIVFPTRLVVGDTTYFARNITSVKRSTTETTVPRKVVNQNWRYLGIFLGIAAVLFLIVWLLATMVQLQEFRTPTLVAGLMFLLVSLAFYFGASETRNETRYRYQITIATAAGEREIFSTDVKYVADAIADFIDQALAT